MMTIRTILGVALILVGLFATCVGVLGLFRFRYVLNRMHAAALVDTLGALGVLVGLMLLCGVTVTTGKLFLILVFLWLTSPVATHLIAKMELLTGLDIDADAKAEEGEQRL